jgi:hypothetical protein
MELNPNMWEPIGNIANIIQIVSAIPFIWGAWLFFSRARRYKRKTEEVGKTLSAKPMALVLALSGVDVTRQVQDWLVKNIGAMDVHSYFRPEGVTQENIAHHLSEVLKLKSTMTSEGVTEVHLFLMTPVAFAVAVGAILDNWVQVKVYHLNREKNQYEYWTYLHKGFIPGLDYSLVKEIGGE